jgi:steroid delta-isomerase
MDQLIEIPAALRALLGDGSGGPVSPEQIRRVMREYGERMSAGDADGIVALFTEDAFIHDPVTSPPRSGPALRSFFQGAFDAQGGFIEMRLAGDVRVTGSYGAAAYTAVMTIAGTDVIVDTLDVMHFSDDGRVASMHAYWGPTNIRLSDRPPQRFG